MRVESDGACGSVSKGSLKRMCMIWTPTTLIFFDMEQGECVTVPVAQDLAALCSFYFFVQEFRRLVDFLASGRLSLSDW